MSSLYPNLVGVETYFDRLHIGQAPVSANEAARKDYVDSYVDTKISDLVNGAPAILDTLKEISDSLNNDGNLAVTLTNLINTSVDYEKGKRIDEDAALSRDILAEKNTRVSQYNSLNSSLQTLDTKVDANDSRVTSDISAHTSNLSTLESKVDTNFNKAFDSINTEVSKRDAGDARIESKFDGITSSLSSSVSDEVSVRAAADVALQASIDYEIANRQSQALSDKSERVAVEAALQTTIDNEIFRATDQDQLLNAAINDERARAENVETSLEARKLESGPISYLYNPDGSGATYQVNFEPKLHAKRGILVIGDRWRINCNTSDISHF